MTYGQFFRQQLNAHTAQKRLEERLASLPSDPVSLDGEEGIFSLNADERSAIYDLLSIFLDYGLSHNKQLNDKAHALLNRIDDFNQYSFRGFGNA